MASTISQHKRMAMGEPIKRAMGGGVPVLPSQAQATLPPQAGGAMRPAMPPQAMGNRPMPNSVPAMKCGGGVKKAMGGPVLKSGMAENPITKSRHSNGIPGMKKGGAAKGKR